MTCISNLETFLNPRIQLNKRQNYDQIRFILHENVSLINTVSKIYVLFFINNNYYTPTKLCLEGICRNLFICPTPSKRPNISALSALWLSGSISYNWLVTLLHCYETCHERIYQWENDVHKMSSKSTRVIVMVFCCAFLSIRIHMSKLID